MLIVDTILSTIKIDEYIPVNYLKNYSSALGVKRCNFFPLTMWEPQPQTWA